MVRYEKYKDSGIEWIGDIPEHWVVNKLKNKFNFNTGFTPPSGNSDFYDGDNIWITITDMKEKYLNNSKTKLSDKAIEKYKPVILPVNSLLFSFKLSIGKVAFNTKELYTNEAIFSIFPDENVNLKFYYYSLPLQVVHNANENIYGAKILNQELIKNSYLLLPPKQEQTAIANYLDQKTTEIDQLITQKERLLRLYEEEKTTIINQAVTKGINPKVKLKDSGVDWLGEIPVHWEVKKMKYIGNFINGYSFKSKDFQTSGVRVLKISNIQHMHIDWKDASFVNEELYEEYSQFRIYKDDLVFALTRPIISTGIKASLIKTDEKILINQRNSVFRTENIPVNWIYYILLSENFIQEFDKRIDKTGQQPNISSNDIGNINIPIPSSDEFELLINFIKTENKKINTKVTNTKKLIALLKEYKTALISEVVTGKIKVS